MTEDIFKYIDVERTIAEFGYDPRELGFHQRTPVYSFCRYCKSDKGLQTYFNAKKDIGCRKCCKLPKVKSENERLKVSETVSIARTVSEFGYDPRDLSKSSKRKVIVCCSICKKEREQTFRDSWVVKKCIDCEFSTRVWTDKAKKEQSERKKGKKFTEDHKNKIALANTGRKLSIETRNKIAKKALGRPKSLETRKKLSGPNNFFFGKLPTNKTVKSGWYTKKDGAKIFMRSSWEIKFAKYLDDSGKNWEYEPKKFPVNFFSDKSGFTKEGNYNPDFLVEGEWFEVKGFWRDDSKAKFEAFKTQYPDEKITLLMKPELLALGIEL